MQQCGWKHKHGKRAMTTVITWPMGPFLHSQNGRASGCGESSGLLGVYCKRRGGVPSAAVWGLVGVKLSFIFSAPVHHSLKKKAFPFSKAQGLWKLMLSISTFYSWPSGNLHGFWIDRSECVNSQHWISLPKKISAHAWESCHGHLSTGPMPRLLGQQCCEVHG